MESIILLQLGAYVVGIVIGAILAAIRDNKLRNEIKRLKAVNSELETKYNRCRENLLRVTESLHAERSNRKNGRGKDDF